VKADVAAAQQAADAQAAQQASTTLTYALPGSETGAKSPAVSERGGSALLDPVPATPAQPASGQPVAPTAHTVQPRRFHGTVKLNPRLMAGNAGTIMDEVVRHLTAIYGADVQVTLEIQATIPSGVSEDIKRTIEENCRTLRFEGFGFEEE